jgi:hypothetical protein
MGLTISASMAQVANSPLIFASRDGIQVSMVQANNFGGTDSSSGEKKWLKVEFHYSITPAVGDYLNGATFKVWIEGRDLYDPQGKPGEGIAVALTGSVSYVNLFKGKDLYGVVYVAPATLGRYCTSKGITDFDANGQFNIHVEADVDGKPVDVFDKNKENDLKWYEPLKPVTGMVYLQNQSPFILTDPDRYPPLKLSSN